MIDDDRESGQGAAGACPYVRWEEVQVSGERGRRVVHYYAKDALGRSDLAVVGREKSARHMSYDVVGSFLRRLALMGFSPSASSSSPSTCWFPGRLRSRREVVDWLSLLVSASPSCQSHRDRYLDDEDGASARLSFSKGLSSRKMMNLSKEFSWLGSPKCKRRRNHYHSFFRNGVTISVHDFVYIMGEDNNRLIAYVEDMYEDFKSGDMILVRWFHKVDEIGVALPSDTDYREAFFTRYYQDLSIECIDGLATVLSGKHFKKYLNGTANIAWESYLCRREIDYDNEIKSFDITQVPGYWNQEIFRYMYTATNYDFDGTGNRPELTSRSNRHLTVNNEIAKNDQASCLPEKVAFKRKFLPQFSVGCEVEVLCQDSGIRGCWFRGVIVKRCKDKVKVKYKDIQQADGTSNLKEWLSASKIAMPDKFGIRLEGRTVIRPHQSSISKNKSFSVGSVVDVWWHDAWWEGIIIHIESDQTFHVYFPGEGRTASFAEGVLRHSLEYMQSTWRQMEDRPDLVSLLLPIQELMYSKGSEAHITSQTSLSYRNQTGSAAIGFSISGEKSTCGKPDPWDFEEEKDAEESVEVPLWHLKWGSSRKRSRIVFSKSSIIFKKQCNDHRDSSNDPKVFEYPYVCSQSPLTKSFTTKPENCKVGTDILVDTPVSMTSLVMIR